MLYNVSSRLDKFNDHKISRLVHPFLLYKIVGVPRLVPPQLAVRYCVFSVLISHCENALAHYHLLILAFGSCKIDVLHYNNHEKRMLTDYCIDYVFHLLECEN